MSIYDYEDTIPGKMASTQENEKSFLDLLFSRDLILPLKKRSIVKPSPFQIAAIPYLREYRDVVLLARTGAGKTTAYLVSLLDDFEFWESHLRIPSVIIIVPSLTAGQHVLSELEFLIASAELEAKVSLLKIPTSFRELTALLKEKSDIVVSTPPILLSCLKEGYIDTETRAGSLQHLVIDDIDQISRNGYEDLRSLMDHVPQTCHRVLVCSDPRYDLRKVDIFLRMNPYIIRLSEEGHVKAEITPHNLEQVYRLCDAFDKVREMIAFLYSECIRKKVLVFCNSSGLSSKLMFHINQEHALGLKPKVLHDALPMNERLRILENFEAGVINCLIASDGNKSKSKFRPSCYLCREANFNNLDYVFNLDIPQTTRAFFHRLEICGGHNIVRSLSLVSPEELKIIEKIKKRYPKMFVSS